MVEIILNFLYSISDFILNLLPDLPDFSSTFPQHTFLYNLGQMLGYWTNGSPLVSALVSTLFILILVNIVVALFKFVVKAIPFT